MCRHVAYWGPKTRLSSLVLDASNALLHQCTTAREMAWGQDNLDGWGFVRLGEDGRAQRYRSGLSLNDDEHGHGVLRTTSSERFLVHVRQMTPGSVRDAVNSAPFSDGSSRFFTHNGFVADFHNGVREQLLAKLSSGRAAAIEGDTDSEVLFAMVCDRLDDGASAVEAIRAVADVAELYGGRYNVLLWADSTMIATRWDNSLYVHHRDGVTVSSEPLDEDEWQAVPERTMVIIDDSGTRQEDM